MSLCGLHRSAHLVKLMLSPVFHQHSMDRQSALVLSQGLAAGLFSLPPVQGPKRLVSSFEPKALFGGMPGREPNTGLQVTSMACWCAEVPGQDALCCFASLLYSPWQGTAAGHRSAVVAGGLQECDLCADVVAAQGLYVTGCTVAYRR